MTGKDLIIYILQNNLENERILNLITVDEAALKFDVGSETIKFWYELDIISGIELGDELYIMSKDNHKIRRKINYE